jgi:hypothetical protein
MKYQEYHSRKSFPKLNENTLPVKVWKESRLEITNVPRIQYKNAEYEGFTSSPILQIIQCATA